jgi:hypothetical protein
MTSRQLRWSDAGEGISVAIQRSMAHVLNLSFRCVPELGLMVYMPETWSCRLDRTKRQRTFVVDMTCESLLSWALGLNYPCVSEDHFERFAHDCLRLALHSYNDRSSSQIVRKRYDVLSGYEISGTMESRGAPTDVRVCVGHVLGYPPVVLQATAPAGQLASWATVVTTLWNNVLYLDANAVPRH